MEATLSPPKKFLETPLAFALVVLIGNAIAWAIPGNVIKMIAREQPIVLGRYSRAHFCWLVFALVLSAIAVFIRWAPSAAARKRRAFILVAGCLGLVPALFIVDLSLRMRTEYPYAPDAHVFHRPPGAKYELPYEDVPECRRSFPKTPVGYGRVECVMSYDAQGFRNLTNPDTCDIITLGDSFTEGSRVSDGETWPDILAAQSGLSVYNLGMSGYGAPEYLASLEYFGISKKPRLVICMLYEGNDFRSDNLEPHAGVTAKQILATSPIIVAINNFLCQQLGAIGATRELPGMEPLAWLPLTIPSTPEGRHYAFPAKQLTELYITPEKLENEGAWFVITSKLKEMKKLCNAGGATLAVAYAPNKAHVLFPLVADRLDAANVRRYMEFKKRVLKAPEGKDFMPSILVSLDNHEKHVREWCERRDVLFISLTKPMRDAVAAGTQTYYTYDQHWSPAGHVAAENCVIEALRKEPVLAALFESPARAQSSKMAQGSSEGP